MLIRYSGYSFRDICSLSSRKSRYFCIKITFKHETNYLFNYASVLYNASIGVMSE